MRSPPHGILCMVKDSIAAHRNLGMTCATGSWALVEFRPAKNADVIAKVKRLGGSFEDDPNQHDSCWMLD